MTLHELLDFEYGSDGDAALRQLLDAGVNVNARGDHGETALHVAARRRRREAVAILLDHGADIDATNPCGKTAYAHATRRRFNEVAELLIERGAETKLTDADRFAVALVEGRLDEARALLAEHPGLARTGNAEEDRILADLAGRHETEPVVFLIESGADLAALALDGGTALHQAAWFGQPANARVLIEAGAPLDLFETVHGSSPLGWAVHGSRYSGGADERQDVYVELVHMLLDAGSGLHYPNEPDRNSYMSRLLTDASLRVETVLRQFTTG
ncbi:MAG: ankyrin repeat domain-containing protein [Gammaproteobacteria bacterium]|nr:ankyrin repeat domain-containing protein [Gammaproteobacteria bacterium]